MADPNASGLNVVGIVIGMAGGLSLFLFGMEQMTNALKLAAGSRMRSILARLTKNRFASALTGAFVTAVIQSSSVTTVLTVGFISAGVLTLQQSVGVIMGANVGTTITAQVITFKVTEYALAIIAVGFVLLFFVKRDSIKQIGNMVMGLGLVFFGMALMSDATKDLRTYQPFIDLMQKMDAPILAILVSALFTALVQSSSATTGIVIVLAGQGFISLEAGIALALGANVGTCATALLAALGKPRAAFQAAMVHVVFNVAGALIWVGLIGVLADVVRAISPSSPDLEGVARLAAETPRQIANAHTLFNVANVLLFIPFTVWLAKGLQLLIPIKPAAVKESAQPLFLEEVYLQTPALAMDRVRLEIAHLGERVNHVFNQVSDRFVGYDAEPITSEVRDVQAIHAAILRYARQLSQTELGARDTENLESLLQAANHLSNVADTVEINIGALSRQWQERGLEASEQTIEQFRVLTQQVANSLAIAVEAVRESDHDKAEQVVAMKSTITQQADDLARHLASRLAETDEKDVAVYRYESDLIELLKRIYYFVKRIAKTVAEIEEPPDE